MATATSRRIDAIVARGEIGGRTAQIVETGEVQCATYPVAPLQDGYVRVRTVVSAISPGTEMTFYGRAATNVYLHKRWNEELRLFEAGEPSMEYPIVFGYRSMGVVDASADERLPVGTRLFGNWRHTERMQLPLETALSQRLPDGLSDDDGVDVAQMGPICVNAVAFGEGEQVDRPAVVFGAGPVGLITAQVVRANGASSVHVVDRVTNRLGIAKALGLETVDASAVPDVAALVKRLHGSDGIPVAWECTGSTAALHEAVRVVRRRGLVVAVGFYQGEARGLVLGDEFHHNGIRITCGQIGNVHPSFDSDGLRRRTVELAQSGALVLGGLPRLTVPIDEVARGFDALTRPAEVLQVALSYG